MTVRTNQVRGDALQPSRAGRRTRTTRSRLEGLAAFGAYLGMSLYLFGRPILADPGGTYVGWGADPTTFMWYLRWWPYAAATGAFAGATAYFWWSAYSDARDLQRLSLDHPAGSPEFRRLQDRGERATLITNIGFGATAACALAAGVLYLTRPRARTEARITAVPVHAGGALVLGGTF